MINAMEVRVRYSSREVWGKGGHQEDKPPSLYLCKQAIEARPRPSVTIRLRGIDPLDGRGQSTQMLPNNDDVCTKVTQYRTEVVPSGQKSEAKNVQK